MKLVETRHEWLTVLLAFLIPLYQNILGVIVFLLVINVLLSKHFWQFEKPKSYMGALLIGFFIIHLIGVIWSTNQSFAWFDIQIKLSFFLIPIVFLFTKPFKPNQFQKILSAYVLGCFFAIVYGVVNSFINYHTGQSSYVDFYKQNISPSLHIGYFAMYINLAIVILIYKLYLSSKRLFLRVNLLGISLLMLFVIAIFFSTSRNGFLVLLTVLFFTVTYSIISKRKWMFGTLLILVSWIILSSILKDFNNANSDYHGFKQVIEVVDKEELRKTEGESTSVRILVWKTAIEVIEENPFFGVGTGDIKDELILKYKQKGYKYPFERKYNAHNQYLQIAATLGIPVALLLVFILASPMLYSWKRWHFLSLFLSIIVGMACLTESVLEVQAGVIFYAFFASLFAQDMQADYRTNFIDNPLIIKRKS